MTPREKIFDWEPDDDAFAHAVAAARRNRELVSRLARWRSQRGLSQADVAKSMQTSQPAVARLESHQHDPQLSTLVRYITALGLSLEFTLIDNESGGPVWTSRDGLGDLSDNGPHDESLSEAVGESSPQAAPESPKPVQAERESLLQAILQGVCSSEHPDVGWPVSSSSRDPSGREAGGTSSRRPPVRAGSRIVPPSWIDEQAALAQAMSGTSRELAEAVV
jgi:transcriptional regulator with XRE-family HTH domain